MNAIEVATVVDAPREAIFEYLQDFPTYAGYCSYVESVTSRGEGDAGTEYDIGVAVWHLDHTVTSRVTDTTPPERIDWTLAGTIAASGHWLIEPVEGDGADGEGDGARNRVTLRAEYDADSIAGALDALPSILPVDAVVGKVVPKIREEADRVLTRAVEDLEGERRDVDLTIRTGSVRERAESDP